MSRPLESVNVRRCFQQTKPLRLVSSDDYRLDGLEFSWGLKRGDLNNYYAHQSNYIHVQPAFRKALVAKSIILVPTDETILEIRNLQDFNDDAPVDQRRKFSEVLPFAEYRFRVVALKPDVTLATKRASTGRLTTKMLSVDPSSGPIVSARAHPIFVLAHFSDTIIANREILGPQLYGSLSYLAINWPFSPPLGFYRHAFRGQFGRPIPRLHRSKVPHGPPKPVPSAVSSSSSPQSSSNGSDRSSKRSRLSSDDDETLDVAKWVAQCETVEFDTCVVDDVLVAGYRQETTRSAEDVLKVLSDHAVGTQHMISLPTMPRISKRRRHL